MQKRFLFPCCLVLACTFMALLSFLPSSASAATVAHTSTGHAVTHLAGKSGLSVSNPSVVTPFIARVSDSQCASRIDFFKLWNGTTSAGGVCFSDNGIAHVEIDNVYMITSGNNAGCVQDRNGDIFRLGNNSTLNHFIAHVVEIDITGRTGPSC